MTSVRFKTLGIMTAGLFLGGLTVTDASAQMLQSTDRAFGAISFGAQTKARTFSTAGSLPAYEETATFESTVGIGSARIVDVSAGVRVWNNVAVGLGWSKYSDTSAGILNASIPSPLLFDSPTSSSTTVNDLKHEQSQIHLSLYWLQPITDKFEVSLFAGPTFFSVKQDLLTGITITPGASTIASVTQVTVDESTTGKHAGFDLRYLFTKYVGAGLFARYTSGRVDTPLVTEGKIEVGGFQYGIGLRVRF